MTWRRPRSWIPALAIALVVVIAAVGLLLGRREPAAPVASPRETAPRDRDAEPVAFVGELAGPARAGRGSDRRPLASGDTVYTGEVVETGPGSLLALTTSAGHARLLLGRDSHLVFDGAAEVRAIRGDLEASVPDSLILAITTPQAQIVTRETALSVAVSAAGTDLRVTRGEALVKQGGSHRLLKAGAALSLTSSPAN